MEEVIPHYSVIYVPRGSFNNLRCCKLGGYPGKPFLFICIYELLAQTPRHYSED